MGINADCWTQIKQHLCIPHFSHTKKLSLTHEKCIPVIFTDEYMPVLTCTFYAAKTVLYIEKECVILNAQLCPNCLEEDLRYDERTDLRICAYCGDQSIPKDHSSYTRKSRKLLMARGISTNFYKRVVHFKFWLKRLQGKEKHQVTEDVIVQVRDLLHKENCRGIHYWNVRNSLKKLGLQKHYRHVVYIMSRIRGKPLVLLTRNQEEILVNMFMQIQDVFISLANMRVNMLSYPYVIKKLCEIKGWFTMAKIIPTLKSHSRIIIQDDHWRQICVGRGWRFIPTAQWTNLETRDLASRPR